MVLFLVLVAALAAALGKSLAVAFMGNPAVNGVILGILVAGIAYIFRQVLMLEPEIDWIEGFRHRQAGGEEPIAGRRGEPRLLASMARMLGARQGGRVSLSTNSMQTLLDGIGSRLSETRETSRYLIGVLIFLGLLGTFYGLLETVRSVGGVIGGLSVGGGDLARAFANLKAGLESPLAGMGTAFSSSLFGLAGSLVLGFLDLQAGQAQNRFYNDLEEWLSGFTRLSGGALGEAGDAPIPVYIQALLEQTADSLENLQRILARGEESRIGANSTLANLTDRLGILGEQMKAGQMLMLRLAENQLELKPALARLAEIADGSVGHDDALRNHLRNIEAYTARLIEDLVPGPCPKRAGAARRDPHPRAHHFCAGPFGASVRDVSGPAAEGTEARRHHLIKQLHADLVALSHDGSYNRVAASLAIGGPRGNRNRRRVAAARSCRWLPAGRGVPVSTGRKIGRSSAASEPNCWALTSSSATAAPSFSGPIRSKSSPVVYGRGEGLSSLRQALGSAVVSINSLGRFSGGEYDVLRPSALRTEVCAEDGASWRDHRRSDKSRSHARDRRAPPHRRLSKPRMAGCRGKPSGPSING